MHTHSRKAGPFSVARMKMDLPFHNRPACNRVHMETCQPSHTTPICSLHSPPRLSSPPPLFSLLLHPLSSSLLLLSSAAPQGKALKQALKQCLWEDSASPLAGPAACRSPRSRNSRPAAPQAKASVFGPQKSQQPTARGSAKESGTAPLALPLQRQSLASGSARRDKCLSLPHLIRELAGALRPLRVFFAGDSICGTRAPATSRGSAANACSICGSVNAGTRPCSPMHALARPCSGEPDLVWGGMQTRAWRPA